MYFLSQRSSDSRVVMMTHSLPKTSGTFQMESCKGFDVAVSLPSRPFQGTFFFSMKDIGSWNHHVVCICVCVFTL